MELGFWQERWGGGRIGFHRDSPHPRLQEHFGGMLPEPDARRVLVPLCGKTWDLTWLRQRGCHVVGVEFVRQAVLDYGRESGIELVERQRGRFSVYEAPQLEIWLADFFELSPAEVGPVDAFYDRAALVAVAPERRPEYARKLAQLTEPGAPGLLLNLVHDLKSGPPHSVDAEEVSRLLSADFSLDRRSETDVLESEPHFRERGASFFVEQAWRLERKASV